MVIAVEGMDGVGKTTIAKMLSIRKGLKYIERPNKAFFDMDEDSYSRLCRKVYNSDIRAMAWFFGLGNIIQVLQNDEHDVVLDRHFLSNYFWNGSDETEKIFSTMINMVGKPDLTILLYAKTEERLERIRRRNPYDRDLKDPDMKIFGYDKMIDFATRYNLPFIIVNTEDLNIEETYRICDKVIDKIQNFTSDEIMGFCTKYNNKVLYRCGEEFFNY